MVASWLTICTTNPEERAKRKEMSHSGTIHNGPLALAGFFRTNEPRRRKAPILRVRPSDKVQEPELRQPGL